MLILTPQVSASTTPSPMAPTRRSRRPERRRSSAARRPIRRYGPEHDGVRRRVDCDATDPNTTEFGGEAHRSGHERGDDGRHERRHRRGHVQPPAHLHRHAHRHRPGAPLGRAARRVRHRHRGHRLHDRPRVRLRGPRRRAHGFSVPGPNGGFIRPGPLSAVELSPTLTYDAATDTSPRSRPASSTRTTARAPSPIRTTPRTSCCRAGARTSASRTSPGSSPTRHPRAVLLRLPVDVRLRDPHGVPDLHARTGPGDRHEPPAHARAAHLPLAHDHPVRGSGLPVGPGVGGAAQRRLRRDQPGARDADPLALRSHLGEGQLPARQPLARPALHVPHLDRCPAGDPERASGGGPRRRRAQLAGLPAGQPAPAARGAHPAAHRVVRVQLQQLQQHLPPHRRWSGGRGLQRRGRHRHPHQLHLQDRVRGRKGNDYGLAAAISIIIFFIVGAISAISFSRSRHCGRTAHEHRHSSAPAPAPRASAARSGSGSGCWAGGICRPGGDRVRHPPGALGHQRRVHDGSHDQRRQPDPAGAHDRQLHHPVHQSRPALPEVVPQHDGPGGPGVLLHGAHRGERGIRVQQVPVQGPQGRDDVPAARADVPAVPRTRRDLPDHGPDLRRLPARSGSTPSRAWDSCTWAARWA